MEKNSNVFEMYEIIAAQTSPIFHYSCGIILLLSNIGSILTNGSVLFVFFVKDRRLLSRTNWYIATICLLSMLMAVFGTPMAVSSCFCKIWKFGEIGCKYYAFIMTFGGLSTMLMLSTISVDKYIYIVRYGLSIRRSSTSTVNWICMNLFVSFGFASGPLLGWNKYTYEGVGTLCAIDLIGEDNSGRSFVLTLLIGYLCIPLSIMIFSYGSVYTKMIKDSNEHSGLVGTNQDQQVERKRKRELKLAVTVILIIGFFLLCYAPYAILLLLKIVNKNATISPVIMTISSLITKTSGVFTPVIYLARYKNFRDKVLTLYPWFRRANTVHPANLVTQQDREDTF